MKKMRLGKTKEMLPSVGIGTWGMGGEFEADFSKDNECVAALIRAVELGMTHIDTAEFYGNGHTEEIVGRALEVIGRERVFITSKLWPTHLKFSDAMNSIRETLRKIGTDHLDLYLIHWPPTGKTIEEAIDVMNAILDAGYTRYIGVSNFSVSELERAMIRTKSPIVCNQVRYNVQDRNVEESGLVDFCKSNNISIVAYSPLNRMNFDGPLKRKLEKIGNAHGASVTQIALAWLIKKGVFVIPKAIKEAHLVENAKSGDLELSDEEMKMI